MDNYNNYDLNQPKGGKQKGQGTGLGIASMVLGICSIVFSCIWWLGGLLAIIGITLGAVQIFKNEKRGMAIAGIICGVIGIIIAIAIVVAAFSMISSPEFQTMMEQYGYTTR